MERRNQGSKAEHVECVKCGERVALDAAKTRLRSTHAEVTCPACEAVTPVRRSDAYRGKRTDIRWAFALYADEEPEPIPPIPSPPPPRWRHRQKAPM